MSRIGIATLIILVLIEATQLGAQSAKPKSKSQSPASAPTVTTITSFDKDHTVIGWLEIVPFESKIFHNTRMLRVLVPANYFSPHNAHRSYPVLYLQDGQNLFDEATSSKGEWHVDETVEHLVGSFKIPPMFVVGIDNAGDKRNSEYLPYPDPRNDMDNVTDAANIHGKQYARFLTTEVMPFIEKRYRISRGPKNTGLGGSSYGGVIALYIALQNPTVFGHVLVESPPLLIGDNQLLKDGETSKALPQKMFIGVGTKEEFPGDPQQAGLMVQNVQAMEKTLREKGMGASRLKVAIEEGAEHNEVAWSRRLPDALLFLYGQ